MAKIQECATLLSKFNGFIDETAWNEQFDQKLDLFLSQVADANLRIFMGMPLN